MKWALDSEPKQLGGSGSDYEVWIVGRDGLGRAQFVVAQIGQCGDSPDGDARARSVANAMIHGLNAALGS